MKRKLFTAVISFLLLAGLLGVSLYVVKQRQDIRQRAANDREFMQVTPAERKKQGKAQVSVVLNKLDPKFEYRLVFNLVYEKNPEGSGDGKKPDDRKKTKKVSENKTYKFKFKADDCRYLTNLDIQLYYRQTQGKWLPIDAPSTAGHTQLKYNCELKTPVLSTPLPIATPDASASATLTPQSTPLQPSPQVSQPDDSGLSDPEAEAEDIESQEDAQVLDSESQANSQPLISPATSAVTTSTPALPSPSSTPSATPAPTLAVLSNTTPFASPTAQPTTQQTGTGSFGSLLGGNDTSSSVVTQTPTPTPSAAPHVPTPTPRSSGLNQSSPTTQPISQLLYQFTVPSTTPLSIPIPGLADAAIHPSLTPGATTSAEVLISPSPTSATESPSTEPISSVPQKKGFPWILTILGVGALILTGVGIVLLL